MIEAIIVSDSEIIKKGISNIFKSSKAITVIQSFGTLESCLEYLKQNKAGVAIVDCQVPRKQLQAGDVSACTEGMRMISEQTGVVIVADSAMFSRYSMAMRAGVRGFCLTTASAEDLITAANKVASGGTYIQPEYQVMVNASKGMLISYSLSDRQQAVLSLMLLGMSNREIAERLYLSTETVKSHIRVILNKLGARDRTQAVSKVLREMAADLMQADINSDVMLPVFNSLYRTNHYDF